MSATGKTFEDLEELLEELYAKVDCLIAYNEDVFLIKANISSVNSVCAEMKRLALKETNEKRKTNEFLSIYQVRCQKKRFPTLSPPHVH